MLVFRTHEWPPAPDEVSFSPRSLEILERPGSLYSYDRVTELGSRIGELLAVNMERSQAAAIIGKLSAGVGSAKANALLLGADNAMDVVYGTERVESIQGGTA